MRSEEEMSACAKVSDEELAAAIRAATEAGDVRQNGFPSVSQITEHCRLSRSRVKSRCHALYERGHLRRQWSRTDSDEPCLTYGIAAEDAAEDGTDAARVYRKVSDLALAQAVQDATEAGDVQLDGCPAAADISKHCDLGVDAINDRVRRLDEKTDWLSRNKTLSRNRRECVTVEVDLAAISEVDADE